MPPHRSSGSERSALVLSWEQPRGLAGLSIINFLLRVVTLGIYGFWAKTEVRRRLWSAIRLNGEPLAYTGTGGELLRGFLVVFGIIVLPLFLATFTAVVAFGPESSALAAFQVAVYLIFLGLWGVGIWRAQRYRLSRTMWRGIRGRLKGNEVHFAWTFFWTALLVPLTLGWIIPWRSTKLQSLLTNATYFGDRRFAFAASCRPLYTTFAWAWLAMAVITVAGIVLANIMIAATIVMLPGQDLESLQLLFAAIGLGVLAVGYVFWIIVSSWYRARQTNYFAANTHYEGASLRGTLTGRGLIGVALVNVFIIVLSLGIFAPIAQARAWRYVVNNLSIDGQVPLGEIAQAADDGLKRGEGLAQAFDFDAF